MNTTGSTRHDMVIAQKLQTEKVVPCKRRKYKSGYTKHKKQATQWH